jgi:hypothetical protein
MRARMDVSGSEATIAANPAFRRAISETTPTMTPDTTHLRMKYQLIIEDSSARELAEFLTKSTNLEFTKRSFQIPIRPNEQNGL